MQWFLGIWVDYDFGVDWVFVEKWYFVQLCGNDLDIVLVGQIFVWYFYGINCVVMFDFVEVVVCILLDQVIIGFFMFVMVWILIQVEILVMLVRLWIGIVLGCDFVGVDQYFIVFDLGLKFW